MKLLLANLATKLIILTLVTSTILTTGIAVKKVSGKFSESQIPKTGMSISKSLATDDIPEVSETTESDENVAFPTSSLVVPTKAAVSVNTNNQCIVMLFGKKYDVTKLLTTHSGGNIFNCGTDMTASYKNKHGTNMSRMAQYIYNGVANIVASATVTPTNINSNNLCIVTISGQKYNVTNLVNTHSGGNIFNCGTDMTASYNGKHGNNMSRMSQYVYNEGSNNQVISQPTSVPISVSGLCLVTISGQKYDVTKLATTHSGGNIFNCGTDMTASYNGKHGTNMSRMSQYIYNGGAVSITGTILVPNNGGGDDGDDREDEKNEDRYHEKEDEDEREDDD